MMMTTANEHIIFSSINDGGDASCIIDQRSSAAAHEPVRQHKHTKVPSSYTKKTTCSSSQQNNNHFILIFIITTIQLLIIYPTITLAQNDIICTGEPCPNPTDCRSGHSGNYCGTGDAYCNTNSIWRSECGNSITTNDDSGEAIINNPLNAYCGLSYEEARQFCYLPPSKSLPCPSGNDDDCPYQMPCWMIEEPCVDPNAEPESESESEPVATAATADEPANVEQIMEEEEEEEEEEPVVNDIPLYFGPPTDPPTPEPVGRPPTDTIGSSNFCGLSLEDATANCTTSRHCPSGTNNDCATGMFCFQSVEGCNLYTMPTFRPTISPEPTPYPTNFPTTRDPSWTEPPTNSPLEADDIRNFFFCGNSWGDASERCYKRCLSGGHQECPGDEECFSDVACKGVKGGPPPPTEPPVPTEPPAPTVSPKPTAEYIEPSMSPLEANDYRNFFYCGKTWMDATQRCWKQCRNGLHTECPADEECFAQADCKNGVITQKPSSEPTPMPFDGTRAPTISPKPTNSPTEPQPTESPVFEPTESPVFEPSYAPTTPFPTPRPTYGACKGDPCPNKEHCRSNQNFCGPGEFYCNEKSIWKASCGVPTDPPTIWSSDSPTISHKPTIYQTRPPTDPPTRLSDVIYHMNPKTISPAGYTTTLPPVEESPTTPSPTFGNADDLDLGPDDPGASFFCGIDWNEAISQCPHRCPSGESSQCPGQMTCYAFTPCLGIGKNRPDTKKPTWEPTQKSTPKPTVVPTTTQQYWNNQNENMPDNMPGIPAPTAKPVWWTPPPAPKPTYAPTGDQCRGMPCDYVGECRSKLGFCGEGIVYCNSASSWIPNCGGGGGMIKLDKEEEEEYTTTGTKSPNTMPTRAPHTAWEAWVAKEENVDSDADTAAGEDPNLVAITDDETTEEANEDDVWSSWGGGGEGSSDNNSWGVDTSWWAVDRRSSSPKFGSLSLSVKVTVLAVLIAVAIL